MIIGGAIGEVRNYGEVSNCRSMAGRVSAVSDSGDDNLFTIASGFSGRLYQTDVENCSSTSPVYAESTGKDKGNSIYAGGFTGYLLSLAEAGSTITTSFASGDVRSFGSAYGQYTSGFAGYANLTEISNCYALGNVLADSSSNRAVYAGGLAGDIRNASSSVEHSFAAGAVTAQSSGTNTVYAGGVVGHKEAGTLSNNAALGASVTVKGSGTKSAARVYANSASGTNSGNYALDAVRIESGNYGDFYINPTYQTGNDGTSQHGATANGSTFRDSDFWTTTLGFSAAEWNFSTVVGRGYPTLANVEGQ